MGKKISKMYKKTEKGIRMTFNQYDKFVEYTKDIPIQNRMNAFPTYDEIKNNLNAYPSELLVPFFIWLSEWGEVVEYEENIESKKLISSYLKEHMYLI